MVIGPNVTGWTELMDAKPIAAVYAMYDAAFFGWVVAILFIVYSLMLYLKTRNITLVWVTGLFFAAMYFTNQTILKVNSLYIISVMLIIELGVIIYLWIWK